MSAVVTCALTGLLLFLTLIVGVRWMTLAVMLARPSCDQFFGWLKDSSLFAQMNLPGPGAAINALVIVLAVVAVAHVPGALLVAPIIAWAGFLCAAAGSVLQNAHPAEGLRLFLTLITYASIFVLPYALIQSRRAVVSCLTVALCSSIIPSAYALLELATTSEIWTGEERLRSTFSHPNIYAFYIVSVTTLVIFMMYSTTVTLSRFQRRAMFLYVGYLLVLLLATKTRSAWVSMLIIAVAHGIVIDRRWLLPMPALPGALFIPGVADRITDLESGTIDAGYQTLNSYAWRRVLWENTLEWMTANPPGIFGHGLGGYQSYVPIFFRHTVGEAAIATHNALLQIYFEMGIAGITSFLLLMGVVALTLVYRAKEDFPGSFSMLMMLVGYMVVCYSDNLLDYLQFQWFFWFTLGSVCASTRLAAPLHAPVPDHLMRYR